MRIVFFGVFLLLSAQVNAQASKPALAFGQASFTAGGDFGTKTFKGAVDSCERQEGGGIEGEAGSRIDGSTGKPKWRLDVSNAFTRVYADGQRKKEQATLIFRLGDDSFAGWEVKERPTLKGNTFTFDQSLWNHEKTKKVHIKGTLTCPAVPEAPIVSKDVLDVLRKASPDSLVLPYLLFDHGRRRDFRGATVVLSRENAKRVYRELTKTLGDRFSVYTATKRFLPNMVKFDGGTQTYYGPPWWKKTLLPIVRDDNRVLSLVSISITPYRSLDAIRLQRVSTGDSAGLHTEFFRQVEKWDARFGIEVLGASDTELVLRLRTLPKDIDAFVNEAIRFSPDIEEISRAEIKKRLLRGRLLGLYWP